MRQPLTRERVVAAARASIEEHGIEHLSLRAIARDLGVTAPALYAHVTDKVDLVSAVAAEYFDELVQRFEAIDDDGPLDRIRAQSRAYIDHALASPQLFRLLFRYPPSVGLEAPGANAFDPATRAWEFAAKNTSDAIEAGLLTVPDANAANLAMWAAVHGVAEVLLVGFAFDGDAADALIDSVIESMIAGQQR